MYEQQMEHIRPLFDIQSPGDFTTSVLAGLPQDFAGMRVATAYYFISNILHFKYVRSSSKIGNERATTGDAIDIAFVRELSQCAICSHARNVHRLNQFIF
jgi:hypothetical protein